MAVIKYEEWFAREYHDRESLAAEVKLMRGRLLGRTIDSIKENRELGLVCLGFGNIYLYVWYPDASRLKMRIDGRELHDAELGNASERYAGAIGRKLVTMFVSSGVYMSPGSIELYLENGEDMISLGISSGRGIRKSEGVSVRGKYALLPEERIPMTDGHFRRRLCDIDTGEMRTEITDGKGGVRIRSDYNDLQLGDAIRGVYRTLREKQNSTGDMLTLYGACDDAGHEVIPCRYRDLYCMANGFFLVMDDEGRWWVLDETDESVYGPSVYGTDIYGTSREFLFVVEYNDEAGFECLGIYDVGMRTVTCGAVFSRIKYIGGGRFAVTRVLGGGRRTPETVDKFGNIISI